MNTNRKTGEKGEHLAVQYLTAQGFEIEETNWRSGHKDIDIICRKGDFYIFVEVKTRTSVKQGMPEESVSSTKINSVTEAARIFLYDKVYKDIRFDVISIILKKDGRHDILHIQDAFY